MVIPCDSTATTTIMTTTSLGGENLAVAQNTYSVMWFKGKELNMVFGVLLSVSRIVSGPYFYFSFLFFILLSLTLSFSFLQGSCVCWDEFLCSHR